MKDKRQVLRSVVATVRKKFGVAIAEVEHQDLWQRATLGVSCVAESSGHCREVLDEVERLITRVSVPEADIVDRHSQVIALEDLE